MHLLRQSVIRAIERDDLIPDGGRVIVALSGGGDSIALATLLCDLSTETSWSVVGFLHVNHQLRAAAVEDELFCRAFAHDRGIPIEVVRVEVEERARVAKMSIEEAGHHLRYEAFEMTVSRGSADLVATGHTRDDLAETVLLRLIRGAGPSGLAGIRPRYGVVVRPLLDVSRMDLREFLLDQNVEHREDESNDDVSVTRNRIRHLLLPFLTEHFSPAISGVLAREAAIARADSDWIEGVVKEATDRLVHCKDGQVEVDANRLVAEPVAVARRVAKLALERGGGRPVGFDHVRFFLELVSACVDSDVPVCADFPGSRITRRGKVITIKKAIGRCREVDNPAGFEYSLRIPGEVAIVEAGLQISVRSTNQLPALSARGDIVAIQECGLAPPLKVRSWRFGDSFRPLGLGGRKKLQDLFVDRKIPRDQRNFIPIVSDSNGRIVWVVGLTVADDFRVTESDRGVLILEAAKIGGLG